MIRLHENLMKEGDFDNALRSNGRMSDGDRRKYKAAETNANPIEAAQTKNEN
jgi:hypothetical protein